MGRKLLLGGVRSVLLRPLPKRSSLEEVPDFTGAEFGLEGIWRVVTSSGPLDEQPPCHGCNDFDEFFFVTILTGFLSYGASYLLEPYQGHKSAIFPSPMKVRVVDRRTRFVTERVLSCTLARFGTFSTRF